MCFKKLRSLKNLCNFTPEDFEYKPSYSFKMFKMRTYLPDEETKSYEMNIPLSSLYVPPKPTSYNVHIEIVPKEPVTYVADRDYSKDGETAASQGISIIDEIRPPSDLPKHILDKLTGDIDKDLKMIKEWKNLLTWSDEEETTAGTGTIIFSKIPKIDPRKKPFRLDENWQSIKWKAKCDECGAFFNLPHEMYLLPQKKGDPKYVCIYCYQEEESN